MKVYLFGNPDDKIDKRTYAIAEKLKKSFPTVKFIPVNPNEDLPFIGKKHIFIMDVIVGIKEPKLLDENAIDLFITPPRSTVHDYDLAFQLKYLKKIGKIHKITIIGIPSKGRVDYPSIQSIFRKLVAQDIHGS